MAHTQFLALRGKITLPFDNSYGWGAQFTGTGGWWTNGTARQGNNLFLASGYWGVQSIALKK